MVKRARIRQPKDESIRCIPLTQGQKAVVDAEDYEFLMQWNWLAKWDDGTQSYYARRRVQKLDGLEATHLGMHNALMGAFNGTIVDHIDGDTLNMRKSNLRIATHGQNAWNHPTRRDNRLGVKGVR
ncbi:HNH endonuclease [Edaphobacter albus]|uniref:HNH endonuclease n=1 Tax=Edaphobacter sp. 4G125 TaxID=2763071 RepID=UPI0016444C40|nr:HNH endonuclease [Edaphobacter sp. 4G125]QNI37500.1 HNH endonuclease [Edaphobacter sp. 4G125]